MPGQSNYMNEKEKQALYDAMLTMWKLLHAKEDAGYTTFKWTDEPYIPFWEAAIAFCKSVTAGPDVEYIVASAVHYDDGQKREHSPKNISTGLVILGLGHHHCYATLGEMFPNREYMSKKKCGFLTSRDRFVDRKQAGGTRYVDGQMKAVKHGSENELFSEDIFY